MAEPTNSTAQARIAELEAELSKYVGKEPTVLDEMAYLRRCLNAVYEVCDQAEKQAGRREDSVPEWVAAVREAADGVRAENADDRRRRLYIDGHGNGWVDLAIGTHGPYWIQRVSDSGALSAPDDIRERTGGLYEIGRCW